MTDVIKLIIKWVLILFSVVIVLSLLLDIILISNGWSYFFGFFQLHFNWNVWLIRIISIIFVFLFIFYIIPSINRIFNPFQSHSKKQISALIIVCFLCVLWFITYLAEKDNNFDAQGRSLTYKAWAADHYEDVAGNYSVHPVYGTPAIKVTPENISTFSLRKIEVDNNTVFFNPVDGTPLIYYYIMGDKVDFFNSNGRHPQYGEELLPVTTDFVKKYLKQIEADKKKAEEELIKQQELERQRQIERRNELAKQQELERQKQELERQKQIERNVTSTSGVNTNTQSPQPPLERPAYKIGDIGPAGGYIFYVKDNYSNNWRYLEAAPFDAGKSVWGFNGLNVEGTGTGIGAGKRNTQIILAADNLYGKAAQLCRDYRHNNFSDWFLPSRDELNLMLKNLKSNGLGDFNTENDRPGPFYYPSSQYWSSSQYSNESAWNDSKFYEQPGLYSSDNDKKTNTKIVRPVRAF